MYFEPVRTTSDAYAVLEYLVSAEADIFRSSRMSSHHLENPNSDVQGQRFAVGEGASELIHATIRCLGTAS